MAKGRSEIRQAEEDSRAKVARLKLVPPDPPPSEGTGVKVRYIPRNGAPPGKWTPNELGLPTEDPCPVQCLGLEADTMHIIDSNDQYVAATKWDHENIQKYFAGRPNYPKWAWPRPGKTPKATEAVPYPLPPIESFRDDHVRDALFLACSRQGLFSARDKLRGRGAWRMRTGQLLYHAGEQLWIAEDGDIRMLRVGLHQGHLYPRLAELPPPWTQRITPENNPAGALLETLRKWNWERPDIDPVLLLGWIGIAYLGGALDWRSAILLLGDKATGKSSLQEGLQLLFGDHIIPSADTTAPAIAQTVKHDSRAVACDELEADADPRKVNDVLHLMRAAASGNFRRRGSSQQQAIETQLRSAFLFSAINNPVREAQDLSRVAILRLLKLKQDQRRAPALCEETTGRVILGQLMRQWHRLEPTFRAYKDALMAGGHVGRGGDTYGTLLACADLLLGPELAEDLGVRLVDPDRAREDDGAATWWAENLSASSLPEVEDAAPNWRDCIMSLLTAQVEPWRNGARATIGKCLEDLKQGEARILTDGSGYHRGDATRDLALTGLGLLAPGELDGVPKEDGWILAVPNKSALVGKLFNGRPWQHGGWKDALRQCPPDYGVVIHDKERNRRRINGVETRCTLIVLERFHEAPER
jgi:hypothetical protein